MWSIYWYGKSNSYICRSWTSTFAFVEGIGTKIYEYREKGIILGQFEDTRYQNIELNLKLNDRFIMYTDGIIESTNSAGDFFGLSHFKEFIASHANLSVGNFADALIQYISSWSGKHLDEALDDDLTFIVADFKNSWNDMRTIQYLREIY